MSVVKTERYAAYKDSGIDWLGDVPKHWDIKHLKALAEIKGGKDSSGVEVEEGGYPVYGSGGVFGRAFKYLHNKPSVLLGRKGTVDKPLFVTEPFWSVDTMFYTYIKNNVDPKFFYYKCLTIQFGLYQYGSAVPSMASNVLSRILFAVPPYSEQTAIAAYLDTKTAQIDRQIDLLDQKATQYGKLKQSLINETVTRGLDKPVPMKDSGVEWIGEVPRHWSIKRLKDVATQSKEKNRGNPIGEMLSVSGYRGIEIKEYDDELKKRTIEELQDYRVVRPGQLVANTMWLNYRGIGVSSHRGYVSPAYRAYYVSPSIHSVYLHYLMRSDLYVAGYSMYLQGIRPNSLQMKTIDFECLPIVVPSSLKEQMAIAKYLDDKTTQIDSIVSTLNTQIDKLKDLRKALINDVVTGKIKVVNEGAAV
ncbi:MAG TPA: hypothetical protein DEO68_03025 [Halomonas campaniensis]|uniref:Type I restriction modification DNA specificity domain-containing protein n=1 Tax=Halomonas campaniensis TaxID=213554 RepID=A0A3D0KCT8_9GAMM|nr:restriction endonuclease subunit S [Halomonas sp. 3F2F]HCA01165.1 hypothetical protein [Halomonas campaniensis]